MTQLKSTIARLAEEFAQGVLDAIRSASLDEILAESHGLRGGAARAAGRPAARPPSGRAPGKNGRLGRRSQEDIAGVVDKIVSLLEKSPDGLRAEQIREKLGLEARELPRPLADALEARRISKHGQKRATTYFAKGIVKKAR